MVRDGNRRAAKQRSVRVIDGDTISLNDGRANVRLVGFNTPETGRGARCAAERQKGEDAKHRLQELVTTADLSFQEVQCACAPGAGGTEACNYGRRCGRLLVNGRDVGATLIDDGLPPGLCAVLRVVRRCPGHGVNWGACTK